MLSHVLLGHLGGFAVKEPRFEVVEFTVEFVTFHGFPTWRFFDLFVTLASTGDPHVTLFQASFLEAVFGTIFGQGWTLPLEPPLQREHVFHF